MRIIARSTLRRFAERLSGRREATAVATALDAWFYEVQSAEWKNSQDIRRAFATASIVGADRVVFNIKGNSYRLVVTVDYERSLVFIKWLGTHKQYDKIDVRSVSYGD